MKVVVNSRTYQMGKKEYEKLLEIASEQVPFGVYAIENDRYAELRCDQCQSKTQLKTLVREFKRQGFKVRVNDGGALKTAGQDVAAEVLMDATG